MRVLGIDYGRRRLGLALSDEDAILASPMPTLQRDRSSRRDVSRLKAIVARHDVAEIVVGLPLNMNGTRGEMVEEVEVFAATLRTRLNLPVRLFDERLTSQEAERVMLEANLPRRRRKELRDSLAATLILQGYLDRSRAG